MLHEQQVEGTGVRQESLYEKLILDREDLLAGQVAYSYQTIVIVAPFRSRKALKGGHGKKAQTTLLKPKKGLRSGFFSYA